MRICLLSSNDIKEHHSLIFELLRICFRSTYTDAVSVQLIESKIDNLLEYINRGEAYVFGVFSNNSLQGFLWGYPVKTLFEPVFHVAYIAVKEQGRKQGMGRQLIRAAEKKAEELGINHVELIVGSNNKTALDFYSHCGYETDRYFLRKEV